MERDMKPARMEKRSADFVCDVCGDKINREETFYHDNTEGADYDECARCHGRRTQAISAEGISESVSPRKCKRRLDVSGLVSTKPQLVKQSDHSISPLSLQQLKMERDMKPARMEKRSADFVCDVCGDKINREETFYHDNTADYDECARCHGSLLHRSQAILAESSDLDAMSAIGRGRRVALLCGGPYMRFTDKTIRPASSEEHDKDEDLEDQIQACDQTCVAATAKLLTANGFAVTQFCVDKLGSASGEGRAARSDLDNCVAAVIPGGHDIPQAYALGKLGKAALSSVLKRGAGLVGVCAGAWLLSEGGVSAPVPCAPSDTCTDGDDLREASHCYGWLPVTCDPRYGDNCFVGPSSLSATSTGSDLFGVGLEGAVFFCESPRMIVLVQDQEQVIVDAMYSQTQPTALGKGLVGARALRKGLAGGAAVVHGQSHCSLGLGPGRMVLIGPHFELTTDMTGSHDHHASEELAQAQQMVIARAVDWAMGDRQQAVIEYRD
jgi:hypothetical protein